jgi:sugar lactone lactonase YvrE
MTKLSQALCIAVALITCALTSSLNAEVIRLPTAQVASNVTLNYAPVMVGLQSGQIMATGGYKFEITDEAIVLATSNQSNIYNPALNYWTRGITLLEPRRRHGAITLNDGRVLITGGTKDNVPEDTEPESEEMDLYVTLSLFQTAEIYDPTTNTLSKTPIGGQGLHPTTKLLKDGRVLVIGRSSLDAYSSIIVSIYNPTNNSWQSLQSSIDSFGFAQASFIVLEDGNIFYCQTALERCLYQNLQTNALTVLPALPRPFPSRATAAPLLMELADKRILAVGGTREYQPDYDNLDLRLTSPAYPDDNGEALERFEVNQSSLFDPSTRKWTVLDTAPHSLLWNPIDSQLLKLNATTIISVRRSSAQVVIDFYDIATRKWSYGGSLKVFADVECVACALPKLIQLQSGEILISGASFSTIKANTKSLPIELSALRCAAGNAQETPTQFPFPDAFKFLASDAALFPIAQIKSNISVFPSNSVACTTPNLSDNNGYIETRCTARQDARQEVQITATAIAANGKEIRAACRASIYAGLIVPGTFPSAALLTPNISAGNSSSTGGGVRNGVAARSGLGFNTANVVSDKNGNIYFSNLDGHVYKLAGDDGLIYTIAGNGREGNNGNAGIATKFSLNKPSGLAFGTDGFLYVADTGNERICRINLATGWIETIIGLGAIFEGDRIGIRLRIEQPRSIAISSNNTIYIATGSHFIYEFNLELRRFQVVLGDGSAGFLGDDIDGVRVGRSRFNDISHITFDALGNLYIADRGNQRIRRFEFDGEHLTTIAGNGTKGFGGDGGLATRAQFTSIQSIAIDLFGQLYVADSGNNRIRRINLRTNAIERFAADTDLNGPFGLHVDTYGNLYTAEHSIVRSFQYNQNPLYAINFPSRTGLAVNSLVLSDVRRLDGFVDTVALRIEGGEYNIGCDVTKPFLKTESTLRLSFPPQSICLRMLTADKPGQTRTALLWINNTASPFSVVTTDPNLIPRYRIYSPVLKRHLYTTDLNEYMVLTTQNSATYIGENIGHYLFKTPTVRLGQASIPYYRLYFKGQRRHFYTSDFNEYDYLRKQNNFVDDEGVTGHIFARFGAAGSVPLYRLYSSATNAHLWTIDTNEFNVLKANGWLPEGALGNPLGVDGYVFP